MLTKALELPRILKTMSEASPEMLDQLAELRKFVARRFDEISMEINATAQQMEMADQDISQKFREVMNVLSAVSYKGMGDTPHNVGVELSAVIKTTEQAANTIMEAALDISTLTASGIDWADEAQRQMVLDQINTRAQDTIVACSFQDLTGQRINKTLESIRVAQNELNSTLKELGLNVESSPEEAMHTVLPSTIVSSQDDIDALFN